MKKWQNASLSDRATKAIIDLLFIFGVLSWLTSATPALARAGGGGSSSGGGGSSSGGGGYRGSTIEAVFLLIIMAVIFFAALYVKRKQVKKVEQNMNIAETSDPAWQKDKIKSRVAAIFYQFQKDWSDFNVDSMKAYLAEDLYKKMVLHLNVLQALGRRDLVNNPRIIHINLMEMKDSVDNKQDYFVAEIRAAANDVLSDTKTNQELFTDSSPFTEYWKFSRNNDEWQLASIKQATESADMIEGSIADFASRNNFFYDPDFGWLTMPYRGVLFGKYKFGVADINNHVAGYYRDKIVEFYTYVPKPDSRAGTPANYLVAQAILPISYHDILIRKKRPFFNIKPQNLQTIETESNEFNKKFCLFAHRDDRANSFELLTPNFMEKIYDLPFILNIEVVDNVLYFYTKGRQGIDYDKMLEILSWAFAEMKM